MATGCVPQKLKMTNMQAVHNNYESNPLDNYALPPNFNRYFETGGCVKGLLRF